MSAMNQRTERNRRDAPRVGLHGQPAANDDGRRGAVDTRPYDLAWLRGRSKAASWGRVWIGLWERDASRPPSADTTALFEAGVRWARGDGQRAADWDVVWAALLSHALKCDLGDEVASLAGRGMWRLGTELEWAAWPGVWMALDAHRARMPEILAERELEVLGVHWLMQHDSPAWSTVWEAVFNRSLRQRWEGLNASTVSLALQRLGCGLFDGWATVWSRLARECEHALTPAQRDDLIRLGVAWIASPYNARSEAAPRVLTGLLQLGCTTPQVLERAWSHLEGLSRRRGWAAFAVCLLAVDPHSPRAPATVERLSSLSTRALERAENTARSPRAAAR